MQSVIRNAELKQYDNARLAIESLRAGHIDAVAHKVPLLHLYATRYDDLKLLPGLIKRAEYAFAVHLQNALLKQRIDKSINTLREAGTYDDMLARWFSIEGNLPTMPVFDLVNTNGVLRLGISANLEPFSFIDSRGNYAGFDVELAYLIAQELEMDLEIVSMKYDALIPSIVENRVHMIGGAVVINEENESYVRFSEPFLASGIGALVRG
jgi:ABC-type amino acid transport substrate-binding protein